MKAWILTAAALWLPVAAIASLPVRLDGLQPHCKSEFYQARVKMTRAKVGYRITSAYRSYADQMYLYRHRGSNRYPVAKPGRSDHEKGKAIDLVFTKNAVAGRKIMRVFGFKQPVPHDPVHWVCPKEPVKKPAPPVKKLVKKASLEIPPMPSVTPDTEAQGLFENDVITAYLDGHLNVDEARWLLGVITF